MIRFDALEACKVLTENDHEKAVAIAKDVLKHLHSYQLYRRIYLAGNLGLLVPEDRDLQEYVSELEASCHMCALGACFISKARLYDNMPANQFIKTDSSWSKNQHGHIELDRDDTVRELYSIFTPLQVAMIESAFEMTIMGEEDMDTDDEVEFLNGAAMYARKEESNAARVEKVMNNIITNNGKFVVEPINDDNYEPYEGWMYEDDDEDDDEDEDEDYFDNEVADVDEEEEEDKGK